MTASRHDPARATGGEVRRVEKPWGYELHWTGDAAPYVGKVLHIRAGARLSLQVHETKRESWLLISGRAAVMWDGEDGSLVTTILDRWTGYTCEAGRRHRLIGITDADIIEVSTPETGTTFRLEDDYGRHHETDSDRVRERTTYESISYT